MADTQAKKVRVTLVRSPIGYHKSQGETARALGLRRLNSSAIHTQTPQIEGMIRKINHLLQVEEVSE